MGRTGIYMRLGLWLCATCLICGTSACEDRIETNPGPEGGHESVDVTISLGFAPEENAAGKNGATRTYTGADRRQAFSAELQKETATRAANVTPDGLYELNIFQYDQNGNQLDANGSTTGKTFYQGGKTEAGSQITFSLAQHDNCQLVIIARGKLSLIHI